MQALNLSSRLASILERRVKKFLFVILVRNSEKSASSCTMVRNSDKIMVDSEVMCYDRVCARSETCKSLINISAANLIHQLSLQ